MTSAADGGGFRFSFGDAEEESEQRASPAAELWPAPTTPLSSFPWITVTEETVREWAQGGSASTAACHHTMESKASRRRPPPQLQQLSFLPTGLTVCFQGALEVCELTRVGDESRAAGTTESRDIVPGKYYGGLKVWSCAPDLARYLMEHADEWRSSVSPPQPPEGGGSRLRVPVVAEVGCGQALPGLAALLLGARKLILQDYNAEVLGICVKPNLAATLQFPGNGVSLSPSPLTRLEVKLVHGDWVDLNYDSEESSGNAGYCDVILGADVTFDKEACSKLSRLLSRWLQPHSGVALIATKVFYFGTNGGSLEFTESAVRCGLQVTEAARIEEDGGMKRVILKVKKPR